MLRLALAFLCAFLLVRAADARAPRCTLRVHLEANAADTDIFATQLRSAATGRNIVIEKVPRITEHDVLAFYPVPAADGSYGVLFKLDAHGTLALDTLSVERRGAMLYVFVNGRPTSELQIDRRVSDGKLYVASGLTSDDVALMKKSWRVMGQRKK